MGKQYFFKLPMSYITPEWKNMKWSKSNWTIILFTYAMCIS